MSDMISDTMFIIIQMTRPNHRSNRQVSSASSNNHSEDEIPMMRLVPFQENAQPIYCIEHQYLQKFQTNLLYNNYRLYKGYQSNIMYVCDQRVFDEKCYNYFIQTGAFLRLENLNHKNQHKHVQSLLDTLVYKVNCLLTSILERQLITSFQYHQMNVQRSLVRLDYIFFIPHLHEQQESLDIEPIIISTLSPLMPLCRYLNRLLEPFYYNRIAQLTTIYKGVDIVQRLETYQQQGHLKSTTLFVTLQFKALYTSIKHEQLLKALNDFLYDTVSDGHIQGMKISAIVELIKFILANQYVINRQNHLYRQISGGSSSLYIIDLLINIYLFYWQRSIIDSQDGKYEIFGRRFNEIFFTWNQSESNLHELFKTIKFKDTSLQWNYNIQHEQIVFLDIHIQHNHYSGQLQTYVYHDWKYEPYLLPKLHNIDSFAPVHILRIALIRAILCCSRIEDFNKEQQYIEYAFLFHRFPVAFILQHIEEFFRLFHVPELLHYRQQSVYNELRRHVREYNEEKIQERYQRLESAQKQCIWYIYSTLKGRSLIQAKRNVPQFIPSTYNYFNESKIEIIGVPSYPSNTI